MKRRIICLVLCISMVMGSSCFLACGKSSKSTSSESDSSESTSMTVPSLDPGETSITETNLPLAKDWQYDVSFPDWQDRSSYAANNRLGFLSYQGQGEIYITPQIGSGKFSLYVNDQKIDTSKMQEGRTYKLDISGISRNGTNSLQVSGLTEGSVSVSIPYPKIISGKPEDVGIQPKAIELIEKIIGSDVEHGFPSAQIAIVRHGELVYENCWGNTKTYDEQGEPIEAPAVTKDTLYDLASVTKMFSTNYAIQYLVSEGRLDIDARISDILGSEFYENTKGKKYYEGDNIPLPENKTLKRDLTIRTILMHQGGFPEGPVNFEAGLTREQTLNKIFRTPLRYRPGTRTLYSDLDYIILGFVVEKVTGQRLDAFLKETFWDPMGLTHITYNPLQNGFSKDDCAATALQGTTFEGTVDKTGVRKGTLQGQVQDPNAFYCLGGVSGHAGLFSNASDLAILASLMLTGGYGDQKFFSTNVLDLFTSIHDADSPDYALGWNREGDHARDYYFGSVSDPGAYGHSGYTGTFVLIDPENDMVVVLLTNKIHSKIMRGEDFSSPYEGSRYTTAYMGFIAEILEIGMDKEKVDDSIWKNLVLDMAADYKRNNEHKGITDKNDPRWKAYDSLMAVDI